MTTIVIVGAGHAGSELAVALRQNGFRGRVVLVGAEPHLPYQRPPLSKAFIHNKIDETALPIRAAHAYLNLDIEVELDTFAVEIDRRSRIVVLSEGRRLRYDKLALTTGGKPRRLRFGTENVTGQSLHTLDEAISLRRTLEPGVRILVIGGGFVGLEVAAAATEMGAAVTVVEGQPRVLSRTCSPVMSAFAEREHRSRDVDLRTGVSVTAAERHKDGLRAVLSDGNIIEADIVLTGVGITPNDALAVDAGLLCNDGILVDAMARTNDPNIVAAGDCTRQRHGFLERHVRLESVQNATDQARIAARTLCGQPTQRFLPPWFWSDQYDHKLQMVGLPDAGDTAVVRGDPSTNSFSVLYRRNATVTALHAVNRPKDFIAGKALVTARATVTHADAARDDISLTELAKQYRDTAERIR
ncbi:FAD-dependent oxidoreductase [Nocardia sp. NPDC052112]|uniref:NAD(P)/FAD-dependent oxidoreductase n=1 Tax=Nocardia sp. NPDC052112 TaxID=3155646 RepID=UPI003447FACB